MSSLPKNPIICVDFDGVLHSYESGWQGADVVSDDPVPGAIDWLLAHLPLPDALGMGDTYDGPVPVIYSARSSQRGGIKAMKNWLIKHGVSDWYFRDDILKFPEAKPPAFLTLDDRCICFNGRFPTTEEMMRFTSWQNKDVAGNPVLRGNLNSVPILDKQRIIDAIGGAYKMPDGRDFWIDEPVVREIARRIEIAS